MNIAPETEASVPVSGALPKEHPDARVFPPMGIADLTALIEDIHEHGQLEPIALVDGLVIDGRNRLRACTSLAIEPVYVDVDLNGQRPVEYVISKNLRRRQLTTVQLALLALDIHPYYKEDALVRKHRGRGGLLPEEEAQRGKTAERVAQVIGISADTVRRMVAIQKADAEIIDLMRKGVYRSVREAAIAAGLIVSYSSPTLRPPAEDEWDAVFTPMAHYLRHWLNDSLEHVSKLEAHRRLRGVVLLQRALGEMEMKLRERIE